MDETTMRLDHAVNSIINQKLREWHIDPISKIIMVEEVQVISSIQIEDLSYPDRPIWPFNKKGKYSFKSGYQWKHGRAGS